MTKIEISQMQFNAVAEAIICDWKIPARLNDTVKVLADHLRADVRHSLDSLTVGSIATGEAERAILKELIVQVLVGVLIVIERGDHDKYAAMIDAACDARKKVLDEYKAKKKGSAK